MAVGVEGVPALTDYITVLDLYCYSSINMTIFSMIRHTSGAM